MTDWSVWGFPLDQSLEKPRPVVPWHLGSTGHWLSRDVMCHDNMYMTPYKAYRPIGVGSQVSCFYLSCVQKQQE